MTSNMWVQFPPFVCFLFMFFYYHDHKKLSVSGYRQLFRIKKSVQCNYKIIYSVLFCIYPLIIIVISMIFCDYIYQHYSALQEIKEYNNLCAIMETLQTFYDNKLQLQLEVEGLKSDLLAYELELQQLDWIAIAKQIAFRAVIAYGLYLTVKSGYNYFFYQDASLASLIAKISPYVDTGALPSTGNISDRLKAMEAILQSKIQTEQKLGLLGHPNAKHTCELLLHELHRIQQSLIGTTPSSEILESTMQWALKVENFLISLTSMTGEEYSAYKMVYKLLLDINYWSPEMGELVKDACQDA